MSDNGRVDVDATKKWLDQYRETSDYKSGPHHEWWNWFDAGNVDQLLNEIVALRERVAEQSAIIAGLGDVIAGRVKPISQLWDEIEADDAQP